MSNFQYGANLYDCDDCKIAVNNGDGTYGTLYDVPAINNFKIEFQSKNQRANGDGGIAALGSAFEAVNVTITNVSIDPSVWATLFPVETYEYGTTPNRVRDTFINFGVPNPYFGVAVRVFDLEKATAGTIIFIPKIKIMQNTTWTITYNGIVAPEFVGMGIPDSVLVTPGGRARSVHKKDYESNMPLITTLGFPIPMGS